MSEIKNVYLETLTDRAISGKFWPPWVLRTAPLRSSKNLEFSNYLEKSLFINLKNNIGHPFPMDTSCIRKRTVLDLVVHALLQCLSMCNTHISILSFNFVGNQVYF